MLPDIHVIYLAIVVNTFLAIVVRTHLKKSLLRTNKHEISNIYTQFNNKGEENKKCDT